MNKKVVALVSTLALGTASVAAVAEDKPAAEKPAKNEKSAKKGHKKPEDQKGDGTKAAKPEPPIPPVT